MVRAWSSSAPNLSQLLHRMHGFGVRPAWYPQSLREAWQLMFAASVKGVRGAGDDWRRLCASYVEAFESSTDPEASPAAGASGSLARLRGHWDRGVHRGFTRLFMPPWSYRHNRLPGAGLWPLVPLSRAPWVFAAESLRRVAPGLERVADGVARKERSQWLARHLGHSAARFQPVTQFTR